MNKFTLYYTVLIFFLGGITQCQIMSKIYGKSLHEVILEKKKEYKNIAICNVEHSSYVQALKLSSDVVIGCVDVLKMQLKLFSNNLEPKKSFEFQTKYNKILDIEFSIIDSNTFQVHLTLESSEKKSESSSPWFVQELVFNNNLKLIGEQYFNNDVFVLRGILTDKPQLHVVASPKRPFQSATKDLFQIYNSESGELIPTNINANDYHRAFINSHNAGKINNSVYYYFAESEINEPYNQEILENSLYYYEFALDKQKIIANINLSKFHQKTFLTDFDKNEKLIANKRHEMTSVYDRNKDQIYYQFYEIKTLATPKMRRDRKIGIYLLRLDRKTGKLDYIKMKKPLTFVGIIENDFLFMGTKTIGVNRKDDSDETVQVGVSMFLVKDPFND